MKNKNKTVWSKRLGDKISKSFQKIGSSINVDKRLFKEDIFASIVHTQMLVKKKIIPSKEGKKIISLSTNFNLQFQELNHIETDMVFVYQQIHEFASDT